VPLQKIKFQTNITVELVLKFPEGKLCDSQFGDPQYMFTTVDERVFFVAGKVAQKIHGLRLQLHEPFEITKAEADYGNGRKGIEWQVTRVGFAPGEQPDGTFAVTSAQPGACAGAGTPAPVATAVKQPLCTNDNGTKPNGRSNGSGHGSAHAITEVGPDLPTVWAQGLLSQTNALVDVYFHALDYASENYGNAVKAEDVRALMTTAFINVSKNGGAHVA